MSSDSEPPPPDFIQATTATTGECRRLSSPSPNPCVGSPAPLPSPRRWDDPPAVEPSEGPENPTSLLLVPARRIQTFATRQEVLRLAFSVDQSYLAVLTTYSSQHQHPDDWKTVSVFDTRSWQQIPLSQVPRTSGDFALSPRQPLLATPFFVSAIDSSGSMAGTARLEIHDLVTRKRRVKGETPVPLKAPLAYSPDGTLLAGASTRDPSRLVLVRTNQWPVQISRVIATHMDHVTHVVFMPDGNSVVSASADGSIRMTSVASGRTLKKFEVPPTRFPCNMLEVSPDGELVASVWGREVHLWYPTTGVTGGYNLATIRPTEGWPLAISSDCQFLCCRTELGFDVCGMVDGVFRGEFVAEDTLVTAAAFSHDSKQLVVGGYTGGVQLFNLVT